MKSYMYNNQMKPLQKRKKLKKKCRSIEVNVLIQYSVKREV